MLRGTDEPEPKAKQQVHRSAPAIFESEERLLELKRAHAPFLAVSTQLPEASSGSSRFGM